MSTTTTHCRPEPILTEGPCDEAQPRQGRSSPTESVPPSDPPTPTEWDLIVRYLPTIQKKAAYAYDYLRRHGFPADQEELEDECLDWLMRTAKAVSRGAITEGDIVKRMVWLPLKLNEAAKRRWRQRKWDADVDPDTLFAQWIAADLEPFLDDASLPKTLWKWILAVSYKRSDETLSDAFAAARFHRPDEAVEKWHKVIRPKLQQWVEVNNLVGG